MSSTYSPCRSPGSSRIQLIGVGGVSRLRSSSLKKVPEPLRRAVADCLSSSLATSYQGSPFSAVVNEAARTLRDYLAAPATIDLAYNVILEHTVAERERSPAVVTRCVALLKRYLLRYKPSEETLLQIDRFCSNIIAECDLNLNRPWSRSLNPQSGSPTSTNISPLPVSSFASEALVKSLSYVRSLVAQHIPKRYFQPAAFAGAPSSSGQSLPSLSSLLSKSFKTQLSPVSAPEALDKDSIASSASKLSKIETIVENDELEFIAPDVLKWRWQHPSLASSENDHAVNSQDMRAYNFLEVGAAALLVGNVESKMKGQPWKIFGTDDMPYLDQLLQSSPVTPITNSASSGPHLRAITASKRSKPGPRQIWEDSPMSTFRPRARQLFQYRHYSEQQPLRLNPAEVREVIAAVCSESSSPNTNVVTVTRRLGNTSGNPSMDVAVSVLIKLVIDMYVLDSRTAAPLTLSMLEEMLSSSKTACRIRAFDLILNLGVHAHLLEPMMADDASAIEEDYSQEPYFDDSQLMAQGSRKANSCNINISPAIENFESWILNILYEILLLLVQNEEEEESVWASALSCLLYFVCDRGRIWRNRLQGLDIRVIKALIEISWKNSWAELVHCKLISLLTNMFYQVPDEATDAVPSTPKFLVDQLDLIGGVQFILIGLLEIVAEKFDVIISSFTHLDKEFSYMIQMTKSHKFLEHIEGVALRNGVGLKAKLSWTTLHSLLHSERMACRQNGYIWLGDLLIAEISGGRGGSIWSNIKHFLQKIADPGIQDSSDAPDVPLPISLMCGLLKSKHNFIRWGFLFVLERLLMRCKFLLDEYEMQHVSSTDGPEQKDWHLEKANAVIDIMSKALGLVFQINETDRINILKMCDILFSQLCLRVPPAAALSFGDDMQIDRSLKCLSQNKKLDGDNRLLRQDTFQWDELNKEEVDPRSSYSNSFYLDHETASMAALLLKGRAIVPMQLIARVPAALLYWPLIQLAGAATDNIALGVAVGSKGRGNLPGATSDIRATLLLLLIGKCTADPPAFQEVGHEQFFRILLSCRELLDDTDSRVAYYTSAFLLKRMMTEKPEKYQHMLQNLVVRAQQSNNEKLLENPYLQMRGIIQLANDLGIDL
ncbi:uncharacterized protein LOC114734633 isoform X3 [Neltuma alba]|uniref:uncharacterized protein LOC114734633 isoform X3 n=1 Tax=Neltuma alba TaxID=207710 RepID=UPI0010A40735|nr:uncharacterized protein LOC114734633 isoform X3 [Prosopis alba]